MKSVTIALRDFKGYFKSPIGYIVAAGFIFIMSWFFYWGLMAYGDMSMSYTRYNSGRAPNLTDGMIVPFYGNMNIIFLLFVPFITMRLFSEEYQNHTFELLMTSPVSAFQMVWGKFLSAILFIGVMLGITLIYPAILYYASTPDFGPLLTSYLGTMAMASVYASVGLMCSSLTENQVVAAVNTFFGCLFLWLISWAATKWTGPAADIVNYLSLMNHYRSFSAGVLNSADVFYYFSFIFFFLFLTYRVIDSKRWR